MRNSNSTQSLSISLIAKAIVDKDSVTGIVYLSSSLFQSVATDMNVALNKSRSFKIATFDFTELQSTSMRRQELHYSVSSLVYLQTLLPIMLLYIQVQDSVLRCTQPSGSLAEIIKTNASQYAFSSLNTSLL